MQVGALFAYPSAQYTGRFFFAVVRTLLPVRIAELLFAFLCARGRRFGAHLGTQ